MESRPIRLSIVLPAYNEAPGLTALLEDYRAAWRDLPAELIVVDNGSTDDTKAALARLLARPEYSFARSVTVPQNRGYGYGLMAGLRQAQGEFVAQSHADLQCAPASVFAAYDRLIAAPQPEYAIVKGRRGKRDWSARFITLGMSVLASTLFCRRLTDINAQPKLFHRSHLARLENPPNGFDFDFYVLYRAKRAGLSV